MLSYFITFMYGFLSGFLCNYIYKLYNSYKYFNDIKKIIMHEAYTYLSNKIFNIIADDLITNITTTDITGIQNLTDFKNLVDSFVSTTKEFNKSYKLNITDGKIQIKINDPSYINDQHFSFICKFFTDNNIDLHIIINDTLIINNKLEHKDTKIE